MEDCIVNTQPVRRQLFYLFLCNLAIVFIGMGLFPILPLYAMEFGASPAAAGLYMASTYAAILGGTLVANRLASYTGRKRLFVATGLCSLPAVLLLGQATALWQVILLTAIIWFAGGIGLILNHVFIGLIASSHNRGKSFGLLQLSTPLGAVVGGMTVSFLVAWRGYAWLFAVLSLVWAVWPLVGLLVQDQPVPVAAVGIVKRERETAVSFTPSFKLLLLATLLLGVTLNVSRLGVPLSMRALNFSASAVASTATISGLVTIPVVYSVGALSDRLGRRRFLIASYALAAVGALSLAFATHLWHFWLAATLILVAHSVSASVGTAMAADILSPAQLGRGLAWLTSAGWFTGVIMFAVAARLMEVVGSAALFLAVAFLAILAAWQLRRIHYGVSAKAAERAATSEKRTIQRRSTGVPEANTL
jgi:MFS transporter, DHA1 family, tetracycline resistance protein